MFVTGLQAFALALPSKESFEDTDGPQGAADSRWPLLARPQRPSALQEWPGKQGVGGWWWMKKGPVTLQ